MSRLQERLMKTLIETLSTHRDHRGSLFEPGDESHLAGKRNIHVVLTEPGFVRGNHRHLVGTEITVITGPALARLREDGIDHDVEVPAGETWRFTIPPGVTHAFKNTGSGQMVLIGINTEAHNPAQPDAVREDIL
jgi:UDP-2-acetamido-2,6-beta-L-arabino-hexul-4-ose reductase